MKFEGKTVLVTGSTQGIGQAIALKFAGYGADVVVHGLGATDDCDTCEAIKNMGRKTAAFDVDITHIRAVNEMVNQIIERFGKIDFLINNAGIFPAVAFVDLDEAHYENVFNVNVKGTLFVTQAVVNQSMIPHNYGRIVNISSSDGKCPTKGITVYAASKAAVISFTKSFALELREYNITSNSVAPGWVASEALMAGERWKEAVKMIPSGRLAQPSEIGEACCFLCDDNVSYINGETLDVNGALLMDD